MKQLTSSDSLTIPVLLLASRVAHLRFTFNSTLSPYILFEIARPSILTSTPSNISFPVGTVSITSPQEVCGSTSERQDSIITPISIAPSAEHFKGYFCARFDQDTPEALYGIIQNRTISFPSPQNTIAEGPLLSAFAKFSSPASKSDTRHQTIITLRVGTSFISEDQARSNIDIEIPTSASSLSSPNTESTILTVAELPHLIPGTFENTAYRVRKSWTDHLNRIELQPWVNANSTDPLEIVDLQTFWTAVVHTLQVRMNIFLFRCWWPTYSSKTSIRTNNTNKIAIIQGTIIPSISLNKVVNPTPDTQYGCVPSFAVCISSFYIV